MMRRTAFLLLLPLAAMPAYAAAPGPAVPAASSAPIPSTGATEAARTPLVGHRATYRLTLDSVHGGDVTAARGTMEYEVTDACDGWASKQRLAITLTNRDGQDIDMVTDYLTWESKDGLRLTFRMRQTTEQAVTDQVEGTAELERPGGPGTISYTVPEVRTMPLPAGTLFPMMHTDALLRAAETGQRFIALPIFDGTGAKGVQDSSVFINGWQPPAANPNPVLAALSSGRVRIAFFDRGDKVDQHPEYQVSMRYWANGIADDLTMDFGEFVMKGKLGDLVIPAPHC